MSLRHRRNPTRWKIHRPRRPYAVISTGHHPHGPKKYPATARRRWSGEVRRTFPARPLFGRIGPYLRGKCRPTRAMGGESSRPPRLGAEPPPAGGRPASSGELLRRRPARTVRTIFAGKKRRPARDTGGESSRPPRLAAVPPPAGGRPAGAGALLRPRPARPGRATCWG